MASIVVLRALVLGDVAAVGFGVLLPRDQLLVDEATSALLDLAVLSGKRIGRHGAESRPGPWSSVNRVATLGVVWLHH